MSISTVSAVADQSPVEAVRQSYRGSFQGVMPIIINSGLCGSGKTTRELERMATTPGRYVFVTDRIAPMEARIGKLISTAVKHGCYPEVVPVHSANALPRFGHRFVRQAVEHQIKCLNHKAHAILLVTHETLKTVDWSLIKGEWEITIDEAPAVLDSDTTCTSGAVAWWDANFILRPVGETGWSELVLDPNAVSIEQLASDDDLDDRVSLMRRVQQAPVYANVTKWDQTAPAGIRWTWFSVWCPLELSGFRQVKVLANHFRSTMTYHLLDRFYGDRIKWIDEATPDARVWKRREARIGYFLEDPKGGSTTHWSKPEGREQLRKVGAWLRENSPADHIMTTNRGYEDVLSLWEVPGSALSPKQAGSNDWVAYTCATMIYSSKATRNERPLLSKIGITYDEVRRAREFEDILQFVFRLSLRDHESDAPVDIRVYDSAQAEFLAEFLAATGYVDVSVWCITEAGIATQWRQKPGRQPLIETMDPQEYAEKAEADRKTKAQKQKEYRARLNAEKIARGEEVRRRGRPKGSRNKPKKAA